MDTILLVSHVDPDGSLPKAALEALAAAKALGRARHRRPLRPLRREGRRRPRRHRRREGARRRGPRPRRAALRDRRRRRHGARQGLRRATRRRARHLAHGPRDGGRRPAARRPRRHARHPARRTRAARPRCRWYYRQRIEAKLRRKERPWVLLVDPGATPRRDSRRRRCAGRDREGRGRSSPRRARRSPGQRAPSSGEQTIRPDAKLLFVAGAGWTKKQADGKPHPEEAEALILGVPPRIGRLARLLQVARRSGRRGPEGVRVHDAT